VIASSGELCGSPARAGLIWSGAQCEAQGLGRDTKCMSQVEHELSISRGEAVHLTSEGE
jgi:hypothetical protein